ncbi:transposase, partial [Corynebacterium belfantii]|nr:transposase [Corynebacterium belfantii]
DSNATFGYRRIWRALRNNNTIVNKKVVRRLMREQGLVSKIRRRSTTPTVALSATLLTTCLADASSKTHRTKGDADGILEDSIMNRSYTNTQKRTALRVYKRTQSVTKTVRELG